MSKEEPLILSGNIINNNSTSIMQGEVILTTNSSDGDNATQNLEEQTMAPNANNNTLQLAIDSMITSNNITAKEPATESVVLQSHNQTISSAGRNDTFHRK